MVRTPHPERQNTPKTTKPSTGLPWFRLYAEFVGDPNIQVLSFEDQRHFVAVMCLKCAGVLDRAYPSPEHREAVIARGLGVVLAEAAAIRERLSGAGLLLRGWQPKGWENRQFESDTSRERQRKWRERHARRHRDVTETVQDKDSDKEEDTDLLGDELKHGRRRAISLVTFHEAGRFAGEAGSPALLPLADGSEALLTEHHVNELSSLFPAVDVPAQLRSMRAWLTANPKNRKTRGGVLRFVAAWLGREQNRAKPQGGGEYRAPKHRRSDADEAYFAQFEKREVK